MTKFIFTDKIVQIVVVQNEYLYGISVSGNLYIMRGNHKWEFVADSPVFEKNEDSSS